MKAITTNLFALLTLVAILVLSSCSGEKSTNTEVNTEHKVAEDTDIEVSEIVISKKQFESSGMKMGSPELYSFIQSVKATGHIVANPNGEAKVGTPIEGKVTSIKVSLGQKVAKGQLLFTIESEQIIMLQQEYAEACSNMLLVKSNLERIKNLAQENITAKKELVKSESEYKSIVNTKKGLEARLRIIGINPSDVESGIIHSNAKISAPIQGNITELDIVLGQYLHPGKTMIELINAEMLELVVRVFEKDMDLISKGQDVYFHTPANALTKHHATLALVGTSIDTETRTVKCIARFNDKAEGVFLHGSFIEAEIITCEREALAIPSAALIEENNHFYVLSSLEKHEDNFVFRKIPVKTGLVQNEMAEVLEEGLSNVLLKGAYQLSVE